MVMFKKIVESLPAIGDVPARVRTRYHGFLTVQQLVDYTFRDTTTVSFVGRGKREISVTGAQREESVPHARTIRRAKLANEFEQKEIILSGHSEAGRTLAETGVPMEGEMVNVLDGSHRVSTDRDLLADERVPAEWRAAYAKLLIPVQVVTDGDEYQIFSRHNRAKKATDSVAEMLSTDEGRRLGEICGCFGRVGPLNRIVTAEAAGRGLSYKSMKEKGALTSVVATKKLMGEMSLQKLEKVIEAVGVAAADMPVLTTGQRLLFVAAVNIALGGLAAGMTLDEICVAYADADWNDMPAGGSVQDKRRACRWIAELVEADVPEFAASAQLSVSMFGLKKAELAVAV